MGHLDGQVMEAKLGSTAALEDGECKARANARAVPARVAIRASRVQVGSQLTGRDGLAGHQVRKVAGWGSPSAMNLKAVLLVRSVQPRAAVCPRAAKSERSMSGDVQDVVTCPF